MTVIGKTLYGTTQDGGAYGDGTIFSVPVSGGSLTTLVSFNGSNGLVGPSAGLTASGNTLYGTTYGNYDASEYGGVFALTLNSVAVPSPWASAASGNWSNSSNWTAGVPNAVGAGAVFNVATTAAVTVTLDEPVTLGTLQFGNAGSAGVGYTLVGSGSNVLTLNHSGSVATITVAGGTHSIDAAVILADNLVVTGSGTSAWTLSFGTASRITDNGARYSLTMSGKGGTLILSGSDSYTGGTFVTVGTLDVTTAAAVPTRTSLTIGAGGEFIFDPMATAAPLAAANSSVAPVPEPSTVTLLVVAIGLLAVARQIGAAKICAFPSAGVRGFASAYRIVYRRRK